MIPVVPSSIRGGGEGEREWEGDGRVCLARSLSSASTRRSSRLSCSKILQTSSLCLCASSSLCTYLSMFLLASFIAISSSAVQGSTSLSSEMLNSVEGVVWVDLSTMVGLEETMVRETVCSEEDMMEVGKMRKEVVKSR